MFEALVADQKAASKTKVTCDRLDAEIAVTMARLLSSKLQPIKALSNFTVTPSTGVVTVAFERATVRGTKALVTLEIRHLRPDKLSGKISIDHAQGFSGYPPAAQDFDMTKHSPEDVLDHLLNARRPGFAALLRNWE
jgi:hypothetical protein